MFSADGGRIVRVDDAEAILKDLPAATRIDHFPTCLIIPGLIDLHIHFPQTQVIASYGTRLLEWLERYTFVEEQKFADERHADANAAFFLDELLRNGTTTAAVYGSVHRQSADALFAAAERRGMCVIAGKVLMDRNAPAPLRDTAEQAYDQSKALINCWHGRSRLLYAVTPRFAITCTDAELDAAGALLREFPDVYMQTHLCETQEEIEMVATLFPWSPNYTAVYDRFGLLGPRSLFGHCIHLQDDEISRLSRSRSVAVFCPTSNLFIGSGLFDRAALRAADVPIRIGLGTDVGGGTSYSMLRTAAEGYKVLQLKRQNLSALEAFHMMTRGNALALSLAESIGTLQAGCLADLIVLDSRATPAMAHRMKTVESLDDELFVLLMLGDDRAVRATYVQGRRHVDETGT